MREAEACSCAEPSEVQASEAGDQGALLITTGKRRVKGRDEPG